MFRTGWGGQERAQPRAPRAHAADGGRYEPQAARANGAGAGSSSEAATRAQHHSDPTAGWGGQERAQPRAPRVHTADGGRYEPQAAQASGGGAGSSGEAAGQPQQHSDPAARARHREINRARAKELEREKEEFKAAAVAANRRTHGAHEPVAPDDRDGDNGESVPLARTGSVAAADGSARPRPAAVDADFVDLERDEAAEATKCAEPRRKRERERDARTAKKAAPVVIDLNSD
jgi:hypothetical protein